MAKRKNSRTRRKPKASTEDVLGGANHEKPVPSKWQKQYRRLVQLRDNLLRRQSNLAKDAIEEQPTFSTHMADAGTDTYDRDFALGMLSSEQDALYQIDQAIDRIRQGKYGICEMTGKKIEARRLEAIPWTRFSTQAEQQLERQGAVKHTTLGARDSVGKENARASDDEEA